MVTLLSRHDYISGIWVSAHSCLAYRADRAMERNVSLNPLLFMSEVFVKESLESQHPCPSVSHSFPKPLPPHITTKNGAEKNEGRTMRTGVKAKVQPNEGESCKGARSKVLIKIRTVLSK